MKKLIYILPVILIFNLYIPVFAAKNNEVGAQTSQQIQQQNQNQVETQNQGDGSQLQINNQAQESLNDGQGEGLENRNQNAIENMSEVARQVQQLLQVRTEGGIGEQIRQIAQEQNQAQTQIQEQLNKVESKGKLARLLIGTDYGAIKNLRTQLVQNQSRIEQLTQIQNQLVNQEDITMVQETIFALTQENAFLEEIITTEEQAKSLLGWLFKFFAK